MRIVSWICAILLLISIFPVYSWFPWLNDWYLQLWKSFVFAGAIWLAWKDFKYKSLAVWNFALVMIAIYYNPVFPISFQNTYIEGAISVLCIMFFIVFAYKRNISES